MPAAILDARRPLLDRLDAAKAAAGAARRPSPAVERLSEPGADRPAWPSLDVAARRDVIATVVDRVVVLPASRGRWTPVADRVDVVWRV